MPAEKLSMRKVREVLRLRHAWGASVRTIALAVGVGHTTVAEYLRRTAVIGITWPVDFAITRLSGRTAPLHPGGITRLPDAVSREAYSHEVSSAGFWPRGNGVDEPMFYAYAYPAAEGFRHRAVEPKVARFDATLGEFLLPYEAVRTSDDPSRTLMRILQSTYVAAAETGGWDREALESPFGRPGVPRPVPAVT